MAEPFSHKESGTIVYSTKLDKEKNVKDFIRSPSSQINPRQTKGISLTKYPKQEPKTDYSYNPSKVDLCNKPHVSLSDISVLISANRFCKKLDLSGCGLTNLPEGLDDYRRLEELNLSNNPLSNLDISSLEYFPRNRLKKLDLSGCGLTKLPMGLCNYRKLEELNLSNNLSMRNLGISSPKYFPPYWLRKLDLSGCGLTELPEGLDQYHRLEELNLSNNPLSNLDIFFLRYVLWHRLKKVDLSGCGLTKLPTGFYANPRLEELNLSNNSFDHQDLLKKLGYSGFLQSGKEFLKPTASGLGLSKRTHRIIFEDAVYTQSSGG
jgi:uncharacterized protein YjbI with pentapeptide repeats